MREDLRAALRSLRQSPTFTLVALSVLTLGIGAATAVFSVVDAVVLRGLPFDEHDRLVAVLEHDMKRPVTFGGGTTTIQTFLDWRAEQRAFAQLAATGSTTFRLKTQAGEPADATAQRLSHEFLPMLRVMPALGRAFSADDEIDGRHRVVILSHGFWQRHYGGAVDVIGKVVELNEGPWEVVGVTPPGFEYPVATPKPTELYVPMPIREEDRSRARMSRSYNWLAIGRLKPGVTIAQAQDEMLRIMQGLDAAHPKWFDGRRARIVTLHHHLVGRVRSWMLLLLGSVILVLLIACANVANLMLARATVRAREMGIRAALGASGWRLARGLVIEGLVLSGTGAVFGVAAAYAGVSALTAWLPANLPRVTSIGMDIRVLLAAAGAALATGVIFGMLPALQSSRPDITNALRDGGRSMTSGKGGRLRSALVVAEVALAVLLLVGAGLFAGSFVQLMRIDPGFNYRNLISINVGIPVNVARLASAAPEERTRMIREAAKQGVPYIHDMMAAIRRVPGVENVAAVNGGVPLTGSWNRNVISLPGRGRLEGDGLDLDFRSVSPGYLEMLELPLRQGRYLNADDRGGSEKVAVINEAAARLYWPGRPALGERFTLNDEERVVVGIVGDIRHLGPESPVRQEAYVPLGETTSTALVIRTSRDPLQVLPGVKAAVWSVNKEQRLRGDVFTLEGYMDRMIAQRRFSMALLSLLGALGLLIASAGVYGVMAYVVAQRTQEIGVRMALGARPADVVRMVLRHAGMLIGVGLVAGSAAAWYLSFTVKSFLFLVAPNDVRIFSIAVVVLIAAGLAACALPARRASRVDPLIALRG
ncbi:MAG: ABC transporter permease [Vicinamibacterales bacterium]